MSVPPVSFAPAGFRSRIGHLKRYLANLLATVNRSPIFVLGNQKSGTTAVAALLAHLTKSSVTLDLPGLASPVQENLHRRVLPFREFVSANRPAFSRDIIKEPCLTFLFDDLKECFPGARFVQVLRDPRENIRSILNRLGLPGDQRDLTPEQVRAQKHGWQLILDGTWMGLDGRNYIEMLALRWNLATDVYLTHRDEIVAVRYEDFTETKDGTVREVAGLLDLPAQQSVADLLHYPFQPKGRPEISGPAFFGEDNLASIERICGASMRELGYF